MQLHRRSAGCRRSGKTTYAHQLVGGARRRPPVQRRVDGEPRPRPVRRARPGPGSTPCSSRSPSSSLARGAHGDLRIRRLRPRAEREALRARVRQIGGTIELIALDIPTDVLVVAPGRAQRRGPLGRPGGSSTRTCSGGRRRSNAPTRRSRRATTLPRGPPGSHEAAAPWDSDDMRLDRVWLTDVRSYESAELELAPGLTALLGDNGQGKTNVLEAIGWLATLASFRGAPTEALIRQGADRAVIRAEGEREGRAILHRGGAGGLRPQPGAGQPPAAQAGPGPARRAPGDRVRARRPRAREGRPVRAPALPRRRAGGVAPPLRRPAVARSTRSSSSGTPCSRGPAAASTRAPPSPSTCGTPSSSSPAGAWPRPAKPCSTAWRPVLSPRPTTPSPTGPPRSRPPTSPSGRPRGSRRRWRPPGRTTCAAACPRSAPTATTSTCASPASPARTHASQGEQRSLALALRLAAHHVITDVTGQRAGPAARRRLLRARPRPQRRPPRQPPARPDPPHERQRPPPKAQPDLVLHVRDGRITTA